MHTHPNPHMQEGLSPAVLLQHGVPYDAAEVVPRVLRDYCTLSVLPTIVTVVTFEGRVGAEKVHMCAHIYTMQLGKRVVTPRAVAGAFGCECTNTRSRTTAAHQPPPRPHIVYIPCTVCYRMQVLYQNASSLAYLGDFSWHETELAAGSASITATPLARAGSVLQGRPLLAQHDPTGNMVLSPAGQGPSQTQQQQQQLQQMMQQQRPLGRMGSSGLFPPASAPSALPEEKNLFK